MRNAIRPDARADRLGTTLHFVAYDQGDLALSAHITPLHCMSSARTRLFCPYADNVLLDLYMRA